jgi:hypothetical protein
MELDWGIVIVEYKYNSSAEEAERQIGPWHSSISAIGEPERQGDEVCSGAGSGYLCAFVLVA